MWLCLLISQVQLFLLPKLPLLTGPCPPPGRGDLTKGSLASRLFSAGMVKVDLERKSLGEVSAFSIFIFFFLDETKVAHSCGRTIC